MDTSVTVSLPTDSDGFVTQECPACSKHFKAVFGEGSDRPISHCPYCGHVNQDCWWTQAQAEYLAAAAGQEIVGPLLDDFTQGINRISKPGDFLKLSAKVEHGPRPTAPEELDTPMAVANFDCCGERIKHDGSSTTLHCIICGTAMMVS